MSQDSERPSFRPPAEGEWVVIPRDVVARRRSGARVELPLWVSREVLDQIPGSIAIENCLLPIEASSAEMTLLFADDPPLDTFEKMRFILNRNFDVLYGQRALIARLVRVAYLEPTGVREVSTCAARFRVQCPLRWEKLLPTEDPATRFCEACRQPVYFCENDDEARVRAAAGQCVAIDDYQSLSDDPNVIMGLMTSSPLERPPRRQGRRRWPRDRRS